MLAGGTEDKEHAMSQKLDTSPAVIGIDVEFVCNESRAVSALMQARRCPEKKRDRA
jgi:hypothetical protein